MLRELQIYFHAGNFLQIPKIWPMSLFVYIAMLHPIFLVWIPENYLLNRQKGRRVNVYIKDIAFLEAERLVLSLQRV